MELKKVMIRLHQTEFGEMIMDGMTCSEPVMTRSEDGIIDNFFVYFISTGGGSFSGPVARIGLNAETGTLTYLERCMDRPMSQPPTAVIEAVPRKLTQEQYQEYEDLYPLVREFAYQEHCTDEEKETLGRYDRALKAVVNPALYPFYREMAPAFFEWMAEQLKEQG